jgi:hypothetical protein
MSFTKPSAIRLSHCLPIDHGRLPANTAVVVVAGPARSEAHRYVN